MYAFLVLVAVSIGFLLPCLLLGIVFNPSRRTKRQHRYADALFTALACTPGAFIWLVVCRILWDLPTWVDLTYIAATGISCLLVRKLMFACFPRLKTWFKASA